MYEAELQVAKDIARKAGDIMLEYFEHEHDLPEKTAKNTAPEVTIADIKINKMVIRELSQNFDDGIIGEEESTAEYGPGRRWICDPIDGTKAFMLGVPTFMFSLGLVIDGKPTLGVLYSPFLNRTYWGVKGKGSYCNDVRLEVSKKPLKGGYVSISSNNYEIVERQATIDKLLSCGARLDMTYGAVYKSCMVAHGRAVGYIERRVNPHDIAGAHIIVEEAGGIVTGYDGKELDYTKPFRGAVISNKTAFKDILDCIS